MRILCLLFFCFVMFAPIFSLLWRVFHYVKYLLSLRRYRSFFVCFSEFSSLLRIFVSLCSVPWPWGPTVLCTLPLTLCAQLNKRYWLMTDSTFRCLLLTISLWMLSLSWKVQMFTVVVKTWIVRWIVVLNFSKLRVVDVLQSF